jgi:serine protease Do
VVGINTDRLGHLLSQNQIDSLGFAIPSSVVKEVVDQLLTQGYVPGSAMLGFSVEPVTAFDQLYYRVPAGLFITSVEKAAPLQTGDILLSLSGCRVGSTEDLQACLTQYRSGDTVSLTIYRSGETFEVAVTLSSNE